MQKNDRHLKNIDLVVIAGPTASGKTELALKTAKLTKGVLINADSVQVYKGLNIGSNKGNIKFKHEIKFEDKYFPSFDIESSGIEGLLFDLVEPDYNFNVSYYQDYAYNSINYVHSINQMPILVGGSGLYIDAVIKGYSFKNENIDSKLRIELEALSLEELVHKLNSISTQTFKNLNASDKKNPRRLIRLIEKLINGTNNNEAEQLTTKFNYVMFYPEFDKAELFNKIEIRVEDMFDKGLIAEVQELINKGYDLKYKSMQSTGYRQVAEMLIDKKYNIETCKEAVKSAHKKYAKRQITWFEGEGRAYNLIKVNVQSLEEILNTTVTNI